MSDMISREDAVGAIYHHFPQLSRTDAEQVLYEVQGIRNDGDTISRQAAIDAIMGEPTDAHYPSWYADIIRRLPSADLSARVSHALSKGETERFRKAMKYSPVGLFPSAEPQERKTGRWLWFDGVRCSNCNYKLQTTGLPTVCPNCGSYNGGGA